MIFHKIRYAAIKFFLIAGFVALFSILFFSLRKNKPSLQKKLPSQIHANNIQQSPHIIIKETDLYLFGKNNIKNCQIQAHESKMFSHNNTTECTNVICKLTTNNDHIATLRAPKAFIDHTNKSMRLIGAVQGMFKTWNLENQNVFYDANKQTIQANQTKITNKAGITIEANQSTIDLQNETITLKNDVLSRFIR